MAERYAAFLSYSHRDAKVAAWLQRTIEGYRVPAYIVGRPSAYGTVPARIGAISVTARICPPVPIWRRASKRR